MHQPHSTRHHPLFSPLALLGALILLGGLGFVLFRSGGQTFSPGELSAVSATNKQAGSVPNHAALGDDCLACHTPFSGIETQKCTACHTEIGQSQQQESGFHGRVTHLACTTCHQEHKGADVNLIAQSLDHFTVETHALFFPLDGAHTTQGCESCHLNNQFTNTPTNCINCHEEPDVHAGQFGTQCTLCHTTTDWEDARLQVHAFPLDHGMLGQLQCETCHVSNYVDFTCTACHVPGFESRVAEVIEPNEGE